MALTKTTTIDQIDAWQVVTGGELNVGNNEDVSGSYESLLYIECAVIEDAVASSGVEISVQVSYGDARWVDLTTFKSSAYTGDATTLTVDGATATNEFVALTDKTAGFDAEGQKWFIKDGTIANSESCQTQNGTGVEADEVLLCSPLINSHASGVSCYDVCEDWAIVLPAAASQVRVIYNNTDADCDVAVTARISKITSLT